ncbi:MAG: hypothetical protein P8Y34_09945 [Anaerolineales bacterium]
MSSVEIPANSPGVQAVRDRILPITRIVAVIVVPFLWLAFLILYFFPDSSGERFAWGISPHLTAMYIGAGYLGGSWLFLNVIFGKRWHRVAVGFLPITAFTWLMMIATFLHWDRFAAGNLGFILWVILYVITPFLVPLLWFLNRKTDAGAPEADDLAIPRAAALIFRIAGVGALLFVVVGFIYPEFVITVWPWTLSPLTARVMCGWVALLGVGMLTLSTESRWSGWKVALESIMIWHLLVVVAIFLNTADFKASLANWYTGFVAAMMVVIAVFYPVMEIRRRKLSSAESESSQ